MSPPATKAIRSLALILVVAGVSGGAVTLWKRYGRLDPYASMTRKRGGGDPSTSVVAKDVAIRHYHDGVRVASAKADALVVNQGRNGVVLHNIHDGVAKTTQGSMQFAAKDGTIRPGMRTVDLSGDVHVQSQNVKGQSLDLTTQRAKIDGLKGQLTVPTPLKGHIGGGPFTADSLVYRPNSDYAKLTKVAFQHKIPQGAGVPAAQAGQYWDFASETVETHGVNNVYTDARAEDGNVIVMAPHVEQNTRTDVLVATGRATYRSAKADFVADKIVVNRKTKVAVFTGNVVMLVHAKKDWDKPLPKNDAGPQPLVPSLPAELKKKGGEGDNVSTAEKDRDDALRSGKTLQDYPMNLKAEEVTYYYKDGERHAVAKGGDPTAFQSFEDGRWWRQAKAPEAHYDGEKNLLDLQGDGVTRQVKLKNSLGDWTDATWMQLSTKEDQTEDDQDVKAKNPKGHTTAHGDDETGGKPADPKKVVPPTKTPPTVPPGGTPPPPTRTGP